MGLVLFTLPLLGAVTLGESIAVLGTIASFLLNHPHQQQPTFKAMTSCWGDPWPITYNYFRCAGKVIQASQVTKHPGKKSKKAGPTYSQTLAIGFAEGPRPIGRIWADGKVIYDPRPIVAPNTWQANTPYGAGNVVRPTAGGSWQFTATITADSGVSEPLWNSIADAPTADGSQVWIATPYKARTFVGKSYNYSLRVYVGDETQLPDSALEELVGVGNQTAYRGLVYIVLEDFGLSKYGNRIPNFEAELLPPPPVPVPFDVDSNVAALPFRQSWSNPTGSVGYYWGHLAGSAPNETMNIVAVNLITASVSQIGPDFHDQDGYGADAVNPPIGSWTGDKLWWLGGDDFGGKAMVSANISTLATVESWPLTPGLNPAKPVSINGNGTIACAIYYSGSTQNFWAMNLISGAQMTVNIATIGGPATLAAGTLWPSPTFDDNGQLWSYDHKQHFWKFPISITGSAAPVIGSGTSYVARANDGATYGPSDFNPDTRAMTAWAPEASGNDSWVVPINVDTGVIGTIYALTNGQDVASTYGSSDQWGWGTKRYAATFRLDGGGSNTVGRFDRQTGVTTFYDWATTWGGAPSIVNYSSIMAAQDGKTLVAVNMDDSAFLDNAIWFPIDVQTLWTLAQVCADVSDRVGLLGKYNYTELASVIPRGAAILNRQKAREFLEAIMPAYFYDLTDIGAQVIGTLRSNSTLLVTIPENDLGAATDPSAMLDKVASTRSADLEIPRDMSVSYYDYNHDYQAGSQPDRRSAITQYSSGSNSLTIPVVLTPGEAANVAARVLYQTWIERTPRKASVPLDYIYITPADIIDLTRDGETYRIRVTKARFNPSQVIDIEGVSEELGVYGLTAGNPLADIAVGAFTSQTIVPIVTPALAILDTAPLRDSDLQEIGVYAAGAPATFGGGFDGELVESSVDGSVYEQVGTLTAKTTMGTADTVLADCLRPTVWDRVNTIDVTLLDGALGNASEASMVNNLTNLCWSSTGEIFQFKTALPLTGHQYRLSTLLRGRYGTEAFTGAHAMGEQIVMIDTGSGADIVYNASRIGQAIYWKGVNDAASGNETTPELLTMTTRRLMPFAPYFLRGARDGSNNLTITGLRRMRWRGRPLWTPPETDTPVTIQIDIYNGVSIVRTLTSTLSGGGSGITDASAFTAYYSAADQTTDFGSTQASLSIIAYQLNAVVGRGYGGAGTI